jgi:hypothetical protein
VRSGLGQAFDGSPHKTCMQKSAHPAAPSFHQRYLNGCKAEIEADRSEIERQTFVLM